MSTAKSFAAEPYFFITTLQRHDLIPTMKNARSLLSQLLLNYSANTGTNLTWPVVENNKFVPSFNPINGTFG